MKYEVFGKFDKEYIRSVVANVDKLINVPKNVIVYFVEENKYCSQISKKLPKKIRLEFRNACLEKIPFSHGFKKRDIIVIHITKNNIFLLKNKKSLTGLLLHEIMHSFMRKRGLHKKIKKSFEKEFIDKLEKLDKLPEQIDKLLDLFTKVGNTAIFLLKDMYTNKELIKKGLGDYLLEYYYRQFTHKKYCPMPVFYVKEKAISQLRDALEFEFSLLSIIMPFKNYKSKNAKKLIKIINRCYRVNISDVTKECSYLVSLYGQLSESKAFTDRYFRIVFNKIYHLV